MIQDLPDSDLVRKLILFENRLLIETDPQKSRTIENALSTVAAEMDRRAALKGNNTVGYRHRQFEIPDRMVAPLRDYVEHGHPVGDFLSAVIDNDLSLAVGKADDENVAQLPAYIGFLYNECPSAAWGSKEKRLAWIAKHGEQTES